MGKRLLATAVAVLATAGLAQPAWGALFFVFRPTSAHTGERVSVRTPWTSSSFTYKRAKKPLRAVRLYLVRNKIADHVKSRYDSRLVFIGRIRLDARLRGLKRFTVPTLSPDVYTIAYWCPFCSPAHFSSFRIGENVVPRYRDRMVLRVSG